MNRRSPNGTLKTTRDVVSVRGLPSEVLIIGVLMMVVGIEILVTYTRLSPAELYYVSGSGPRLATRQFLLFLGFPAGVLAIAVAGLVTDSTSSRLVVRSAVAALLGALSVAVGRWDEAELSLRSVSALGIAACVTAVGISWIVLRRDGRAPLIRRIRGDGVRLVIASALAVIAIPWLLADLGLSTDQIPGLRSVFITEALRPDPGRAKAFSAVHDGHHHGMDGVLLAWSALLLSRVLPRLKRPNIRGPARAYVSFVFVLGAANAIQDFWTEQLFKRGSVSVLIPHFTSPTLTLHWLVLIAATVTVFVLSSHLCRPADQWAPAMP